MTTNKMLDTGTEIFSSAGETYGPHDKFFPQYLVNRKE